MPALSGQLKLLTPCPPVSEVTLVWSPAPKNIPLIQSAAAALLVAAITPIVDFERATVALVTAPDEKALNPSAAGAFSVVAMTIAASRPILAVAIAAVAAAPPIPILKERQRHSAGGRPVARFTDVLVSGTERLSASMSFFETRWSVILPIRRILLHWLAELVRCGPFLWQFDRYYR